jgi:hypothetical protein
MSETPWQRLSTEARERLRKLWREWVAAREAAAGCPEPDSCACGLVAEEAAAAYVAAAMSAHAGADGEGER